VTKIPEAVARSARAVAAFVHHCPDIEAAESTVAIAILQERERCAMIADDYDQAPGDDSSVGPIFAAQVAVAQSIADRIRKGG